MFSIYLFKEELNWNFKDGNFSFICSVLVNVQLMKRINYAIFAFDENSVGNKCHIKIKIISKLLDTRKYKKQDTATLEAKNIKQGSQVKREVF